MPHAHQIVREAYDVLKSDGRLLVVANRFLPFDRTIADVFGRSAVSQRRRASS
jgi:16S rRNA G1207 methylase RsmC